jgi:NhaA family Na+:H+ antiporter
MIARMIVPGGHPAVPFLLLLAIADDAMGLIILAMFYPSGAISLGSLAVLMTAAILLAIWLRRRRMQSFWPYVIGAGSLSCPALYTGGFDPALALVPIVPFMPHSASDIGLFDPSTGRPSFRYVESLRALVGRARAVCAAAVRLRQCGRPI